MSSESLFLGMALGTILWIAVIDQRTRRIPDSLLILFILTSGIFTFLRGSIDPFAVLLSGGFFVMQWILSRGKWIGSGDIFLGVGLSLLLRDLPHVILMLMLAYTLGALVSIFLLSTKKLHRRESISFAPFLAAGGFLSLFFGDALLQALERGI